MKYGEEVRWEPAKPRLRPTRLVVTWLIAGISVWVAAALLPGVALEQAGSAFLVAFVIGVLNTALPPLPAALRLPFMLVAGFLLVLLADARVLRLASDILPDYIRPEHFGDAMLAALLNAAVSLVLQVIIGTNDDGEYTLRVTQRIARRQGITAHADVPGIVYLEIDGVALLVLPD